MAYNTGNPIGSKSPKDLSDNAQNLDLLMLGGNPSYPDRKGVSRKSWKGMEAEYVADHLRRAAEFYTAQTERQAQFNAFLDASGYEAPVPYAPGLTLVRATQTVTYLGKEYRAKSQFLPLTTTNWATDESKLKLIGDDSLRQDMANQTDPKLGVGMSAWQRSVGSPQVYGLRGVLDSNRISVWEKQFADLASKPLSTASNPKTWDWQPAIQGAINYVKSLALIASDTYGLPSIVIKPYQYKMLSGVTLPPWVKIVFEGVSIWDFSEAPIGGNHVTITATPLPVPAAIFSYNGACLDATGGGLLIRGHGLTESASAGIFAGNAVAGQSISREIGLVNISVWNCNRAIEFGKYGTYLFSATGCRFENNFYSIVTPRGIISNSGERMVFDKCIFGGSGLDSACILHQCDTFDLFFTNCSFDFNHDVLRLGYGSTYAAVTFDTCHFEGWDGYLVNWRSGGANVYVTFNTCTLLPTTYRLAKPLVLNSPSRTLVMFDGAQFGRCEVTFNNPIIRNTYFPWTEDPFIAADTNPQTDPAGRRLVHINGYKPYSFSIHGARGTVSNLDFDFQKDVVGTAATALTCWDRSNNENVASAILEDDGSGKKVLAVVGTSVPSTHFFMKSKHRYPVVPGQTAYVWSAASIKGLVMPSGTDAELPNITLGVEFEYADGVKVNSPINVQHIGKQFADNQMPNFAEGNARYMSSGSFGIVVPAGVVAVRPRIGYTNFVGKLYISRIGLWMQ